MPALNHESERSVLVIYTSANPGSVVVNVCMLLIDEISLAGVETDPVVTISIPLFG